MNFSYCSEALLVLFIIYTNKMFWGLHLVSISSFLQRFIFRSLFITPVEFSFENYCLGMLPIRDSLPDFVFLPAWSLRKISEIIFCLPLLRDKNQITGHFERGFPEVERWISGAISFWILIAYGGGLAILNVSCPKQVEDFPHLKISLLWLRVDRCSPNLICSRKVKRYIQRHDYSWLNYLLYVLHLSISYLVMFKLLRRCSI